ncbi:hypothetical protein EK21DRAFT_102841 [Setomelanomma holmii]|uniref:Nephrocystin 3-like N-terminal domain-containing protein n=1 Tax=Setomelanomma holmii TaxID=210430 RepID=A0A9P4LKF1_9PLEO|nr:hypothetical protein EK21DRAFT_102841 [Setomelanomma holmii]
MLDCFIVTRSVRKGLAAIGLAGNIVQFISFSSVLISKSREIHQSASGACSESVSLTIIAKDIRTFSNQVLSSGKIGHYSELAKHCVEIAEQLLGAIQNIRARRPTSGLPQAPMKWQSFRKALKYVWTKDQIEELKARLGGMRDQIMMHMIADSGDQQSRMTGLLADSVQQNARLGFNTDTRIQDLAFSLQCIQNRVADIHNDEYWRKLSEAFSSITAQVQQVSRHHDIVASLRYEFMETRHDAIADVHKRTFEWILNSRSLPSDDPRSQITFANWLRCGDGIYWVTGKPGSGKSTLMKYLYDHRDSVDNLRIWAACMPLVRASFYFWNPGQRMQKSMEGLLQTLLYHILQACPEIAPQLCSSRLNARTRAPDDSASSAWTLQELRKAISRFTMLHSVSTNFYFHVDGLDEYHGDSWEIIDLLRDLSKTPNVKLCLSSRPWNEFQDEYGKSNPNMLRLHELIREDVEAFARDGLQSYIRNPDFELHLFDELVRNIGDRAQGVFLWVHLAVRSLRDGITNEDLLQIPHERLRAIPLDLEEFFELILGSLIRKYQFPAMRWADTDIQRKVHQTQRRLNGRFKVSIGCVDYVRYRLAKQCPAGTLDSLLRHALNCLWAPKETSSYYHGADPHTKMIGGCLLDAFLDQLPEIIDGDYEEETWAVFQIFLNKRLIRIDTRIDVWHRLLIREGSMSKLGTTRILRYFKRLFHEGLKPNSETSTSTTMWTAFLRVLQDSATWPGIVDVTLDERLECTREFHRHGADIDRVYKDFPSHMLGGSQIREEIACWPELVFIPSRNAQLEVFLEHGLDLNSPTQGSATSTDGPIQESHQHIDFHGTVRCQKEVVEDRLGTRGTSNSTPVTGVRIEIRGIGMASMFEHDLGNLLLSGSYAKSQRDSTCRKDSILFRSQDLPLRKMSGR